MKRRGFVLAACLLPLACATRQPPPAAQQLPARFTVSGRLAVNAAGRGYSAGFVWQHSDGQDSVDVSNPLGQVLARLELDGRGARYTDSQGRLHEADNLETLAERDLGWRLPAKGLRYWLLGLADPASPATWHDEPPQRLLEQDGWRIRYPHYAQSSPQRLILNRPDLEVRIVLTDWQLSPTL